MKTVLYADYNATTPPGEPARSAMIRAMDLWGNPSSAHQVGRGAREVLTASRNAVAAACKVAPEEVVFTSGGSEANTLAIFGAYLENPDLRVLSSPLEHSSVRLTLEELKRRGVPVTYWPIDPRGNLDLDCLNQLLDEQRPHLVSVMTANNETGVLFPVDPIGKACRERGIIFHTDAVQSLGKVSRPLPDHCDLVSLSSHKIYGPKGAGALIVRNGKKLRPTVYGGTQETRRRGGTEPLIAIAGFGAACSDLPDEEEMQNITALRDHFETALRAALPEVAVQGETSPRVGNTSNVRFPGISAPVLLAALDLQGVCASSGSACSSGSIKPSPVLLAMGLTEQQASECIRFSWGRDTTQDQIDTTLGIVIGHVQRIWARKRP